MDVSPMLVWHSHMKYGQWTVLLPTSKSKIVEQTGISSDLGKHRPWRHQISFHPVKISGIFWKQITSCACQAKAGIQMTQKHFMPVSWLDLDRPPTNPFWLISAWLSQFIHYHLIAGAFVQDMAWNPRWRTVMACPSRLETGNGWKNVAPGFWNSMRDGRRPACKKNLNISQSHRSCRCRRSR